MRQVPTWPGPFSGRGSTFFSSYYERPEDLNTVLLIKFSRCAYTDIFCVCPALSRLSNCNNEIQKTCIGYIDDNACKRVETRDTSGTRPMIPAGVPHSGQAAYRICWPCGRQRGSMRVPAHEINNWNLVWRSRSYRIRSGEAWER